MQKARIIKIIGLAVLVIAAVIVGVLIFPRPVMAPEPESPSPTPTEEPSATVREAYIPDPGELIDISDISALSPAAGYMACEWKGSMLEVSWDPVENIDYYVLCVLDEQGNIILRNILFGDISEWEFDDFEGASLLILCYKDMGEDGVDDDELVAVYKEEIAPLETPEPSPSPTETTEPTEKPTEKPTAKPSATPAVTPEPAKNKYYIIVDKADHAFSIFELDENNEYTVKVKTFPCALGKSSKMTPTGKFKIGAKQSWKTWTGYSPDRYSPYATYYTKANGQGLYIHGAHYTAKSFDTLIRSTYEDIGDNKTSGCVRTTVAAARWVYYNCDEGTVIEIVSSSSRVSWPGLKAIDEAMPNWDPTDPSKPDAPEPSESPSPSPSESVEPSESPSPSPSESVEPSEEASPPPSS